MEKEDELEETIHCCSCGNEIDEVEEIEIDGHTYCDSCAYTCDSCSNYTVDNHGDGDTILCSSCRNDYYFVCDDCGNLNHNDNYQGNGYCTDCYVEVEEFSSAYVEEADFKPEPIFFGEESLKFGIELEIDSKTQDRNDYENFAKKLSETGRERIYLKKDGSLSDVGIEIVSHPMDLVEHKKYQWQEILDLSKNCGYKSHDTNNCGLHIHINKNYLTYSEQIRLGIFIAMNKEPIEKIARRTEERYAKFKEIDKLKDANKNDRSRYEAINWNNSETIEFRFFKGTLKHSTFLASIEFIHSVVDFIKQTTVTKIVKSNVFKLYLEHIEKLKEYTILRQYLKERGV